MIYKLSKNIRIDAHGYRVLKNGNPINYNCLPLEDIDLKEVENAMKYTCYLAQQKACTTCSYDLKHRAEKHLRLDEFKDKQSEAYISNGALIASMSIKGFKFKTHYLFSSSSRTKDKKNISVIVDFNVAKKSL